MEENNSGIGPAFAKVIIKNLRLEKENEILILKCKEKDLEKDILQIRLDSSLKLVADYKAEIDNLLTLTSNDKTS